MPDKKFGVLQNEESVLFHVAESVFSYSSKIFIYSPKRDFENRRFCIMVKIVPLRCRIEESCIRVCYSAALKLSNDIKKKKF